jgi:hypothetical protein
MNDNIVPFERRAAPPPPEDFDTAMAIETCQEMLEALQRQDVPWKQAAAFATYFLIHLNDLAQRARVLGKPLTFADDVDLVSGIENVTDLISKMRNAICHIRSPSRNINEGTFVFNRVIGYMPNAIMCDGISLGCNYADDVAVYYGQYRFYVRRHGQRAIDELRVIFAPK